MVKYMAVAVAVAVAVSGGGAVAVAVAVAGLTKRFFNHIQKGFLINVWGYFRETGFSGPVPESSEIEQMANCHFDIKVARPQTAETPM